MKVNLCNSSKSTVFAYWYCVTLELEFDVSRVKPVCIFSAAAKPCSEIVIWLLKSPVRKLFLPLLISLLIFNASWDKPICVFWDAAEQSSGLVTCCLESPVRKSFLRIFTSLLQRTVGDSSSIKFPRTIRSVFWLISSSCWLLSTFLMYWFDFSWRYSWVISISELICTVVLITCWRHFTVIIFSNSWSLFPFSLYLLSLP